ncbi:non-hydrolyzing UDP-N-acetylglucosamine 2-epimerase [Clostridium brassicae]|uniref:UDP-N-acetylglucosamine 2-epimerase (Non-hydrolyzing) n=1 Tax=Clostridium brassicae TaxID=2999072 RepID=A0ABT4DBA3_9CLOT|nr:UDP-N-acetylglucosamine 2-epimerase (non-hydrolyzing) [Clostridium brassicae]MCY6959575.1 UDP-N-acetylglucosamine 2-epimerase (non-hydrolyzing) [Clostridium brassicae]
MKFLTVIGARPQFIKATLVSKKLRESHNEIIVHTGQHYDKNMSEIFFKELAIPKPDYNLKIGSASHGRQTGEMLIKIEEVILKEKPDSVIVYGDTNSTLAGALAASKLHIPVIHIESGLRSFNKKMPEEQNRILTDNISTYLFCPTKTAVDNLRNERIIEDVYNTGDVMYDSTLFFGDMAQNKFKEGLAVNDVKIEEKNYYLATLHRAENTDNIEKITTLLNTLNKLDSKVIIPVHPRIKNIVKELNKKCEFKNISIIEPVGYLKMLYLIKNAKKVLTDSGGMQKEAYFLNTPCITLRNETEWIETLNGNLNVLCKIDCEDIIDKAYNTNIDYNMINKNYFGKGKAVIDIINLINTRVRC